MKRIAPYYFVLLLLIIAVPFSLTFAKSKNADNDKKTETVAEIRERYIAAGEGVEKVRVLVVPGHEPGNGGAVYQGVYEREIVAEIANQLEAYLEQNQRLEVVVSRSETSWSEDLDEYFEEEWEDIEDFVKEKKRTFNRLVRKGEIETRDADEQVDHAAAPTEVALRLYGINKWANENDIDFVVHLHVNDTTDHGPNEPSAHSGYTVYVPDAQYGNADTSRELAEDIAARLSVRTATSTLPVENQGVTEDQELIAIGAYDTLTIPTALIEYGYITESKFNHPEVREVVTKDFAYQTYLGIQDFLGASVQARYSTVALPYTFITSPAVGSSSPAVYSLQTALHAAGFYPIATTSSSTGAVARTLTDCPISGLMDPCTVDGIKAFQKSRSMPETGILNPSTLAALNLLFSESPMVTMLPASAPATTSLACDLPKNSLTLNDTDSKKGGDVSRLQKLLSTDAAIYPQKLVTGLYGPATQKAVQAFQTREGIAKKGEAGYGLVGPKTRTALSGLCK